MLHHLKARLRRHVPLLRRVPSKPLRFLRETPHYVLDATVYDTRCLFVTFAHAQCKVVEDAAEPAWGASFFDKRRISTLAVKPRRIDWYQGEDLSPALATLRAEGFFARFDRRITYGSSMGGFAALAFADQVQATDVLAMSPQITMRPDLVPWENRFPLARQVTWSADNADSVGKSLAANRVWVVIDRYCGHDLRQVSRLRQPNLRIINAPFLGHGQLIALNQLQALSPLLDTIQTDSNDLHGFYRALRDRRRLPRYYKIIQRHPRARQHPARLAVIAAARARHEIP